MKLMIICTTLFASFAFANPLGKVCEARDVSIHTTARDFAALVDRARPTGASRLSRPWWWKHAAWEDWHHHWNDGPPWARPTTLWTTTSARVESSSTPTTQFTEAPATPTLTSGISTTETRITSSLSSNPTASTSSQPTSSSTVSTEIPSSSVFESTSEASSSTQTPETSSSSKTTPEMSSTTTTNTGPSSSIATSSETSSQSKITFESLSASNSIRTTTITTSPENAPSFTTTTTTSELTSTSFSSSSASSTGTFSPPGTQILALDTARILEQHNLHRQNHSAAALIWSDRMTSYAQEIAKSCVYRHSNSIGDGRYGQNIGAGPRPDEVPAMITNRMYNDELELYPGYGIEPDTNNVHLWGHMSQIVWKETREVGCATVQCDVLGNVAENVPPRFTVCNYYPPGNSGNYAENVQPPSGMPIVWVPE